VNPQSKIASFQMHVNHLISFITIGVAILLLGAIIAMFPDIAFEEAGAFSYVRAAGAVGTAVIFGLLLASGASLAYAAPPRGVPPPGAAVPADVAPAPLQPAAP
jgi:cytochrome c-type biogenesis protein CcmF